MTDSIRSTRASETRQSRPKVWQRPNKLDTPVPPPGYRYRWVRYTIRNEEDNMNVYGRNREGYEVVRPDDLAGGYADVVSEGKHEGVVRSGDLILMKVPEEIADQRNSFYEGQAKAMQQAVDMELDRNDSDLLPITKERSSTATTRGGARIQTDI